MRAKPDTAPAQSAPGWRVGVALSLAVLLVLGAVAFVPRGEAALVVFPPSMDQGARLTAVLQAGGTPIRRTELLDAELVAHNGDPAFYRAVRANGARFSLNALTFGGCSTARALAGFSRARATLAGAR